MRSMPPKIFSITGFKQNSKTTSVRVVHQVMQRGQVVYLVKLNTGVRVVIADWDREAGRVIPGRPNATEINIQLEKISAQLIPMLMRREPAEVVRERFHVDQRGYVKQSIVSAQLAAARFFLLLDANGFSTQEEAEQRAMEIATSSGDAITVAIATPLVRLFGTRQLLNTQE